MQYFVMRWWYFSSLSLCSLKKGLLNIFPGKHLCQSLYFKKVSTLLLKKRLWHRCFAVSLAKFFKNTFFCKTPWLAASMVRRYSYVDKILNHHHTFLVILRSTINQNGLKWSILQQRRVLDICKVVKLKWLLVLTKLMYSNYKTYKKSHA